ncbi:unnamed protein product [Rhizopus stolonifer]
MLLERDFNTLCSSLNIHSWLIKAFVNQVKLDSALVQETLAWTFTPTYFPTQFSTLDHILGGGLRFNHITELCGPNCGQTKFISHLLASYASNISSTGIYVLGSSESFGPKTTREVFKRRGVDSSVLSQIEFSQIFSLQDLSVSLERLGALLATATENDQTLVVIENMSEMVGKNEWSSKTMQHLVEIMKSLSRLGCCVLIQHDISKSEIRDMRTRLESYWNPMIDIRLYMNRQLNGDHMIEIIKTRDKIFTRSCLIGIE